MTLLETLALLTLVATVIYETVDVTLKVLQYIESKQNKNLLTACQEKKANKAKKHREKSVTLTDQLPESGWSVLLNKEYQWL